MATALVTALAARVGHVDEGGGGGGGGGGEDGGGGEGGGGREGGGGLEGGGRGRSNNSTSAKQPSVKMKILPRVFMPVVGLRQQRRRGRRRRGWRRRGRRRQVAEQDEPTPPLPPTRAAQLLERPSQVVVAAATCGAWGDVHSAMAARAAEKAVATAAAAAMVLEASMAAVLVAAASEVAAPSANRHRGTLTTHYPDLENGRAVFQALPTQGIPGSGDHHRGRRRSRRHAPAAEKSTPCPNDQQYVQCTGFRFAAKVCRAMRALISTVPRRRASREEGGYLAEIPIHGSIMSLSSSIQLFAVPPRAARYTPPPPPSRSPALRRGVERQKAKTVPRILPWS